MREWKGGWMNWWMEGGKEGWVGWVDGGREGWVVGLTQWSESYWDASRSFPPLVSSEQKEDNPWMGRVVGSSGCRFGVRRNFRVVHTDVIH